MFKVIAFFRLPQRDNCIPVVMKFVKKLQNNDEQEDKSKCIEKLFISSEWITCGFFFFLNKVCKIVEHFSKTI